MFSRFSKCYKCPCRSKLSSVKNLTSKSAKLKTTMNLQLKLVILTIGVCSVSSLVVISRPKTTSTQHTTTQPTSANPTMQDPTTQSNCLSECFDCSLCDYQCNQACDSSHSTFLCTSLIEQCKIDHGCNDPGTGTNITIYPAAYYDTSQPQYKPQTLNMRKNCCYELTGIYDKTLSGLKTNDICVILYSGHGCIGQTLTIDSNFPCLSWIDCPERLGTKGATAFNDQTSAMRLC